MNISEIKELIQLIDETEINELELENDGIRLVLRKGGHLVQTMQPVLPVEAERVVQTPGELSPTSTPTQPIAESPENLDSQGYPVKSPMVGTFYRAPRPDADPFVSIGDQVKEGQTLCIIEAMKLMNEIEAEIAGKVVDILLEDGQAVEYGQTLFLIDPEK